MAEAIKVKKFGGTSLASPTLIRNCARLVEKNTVVVVSAMAGETNRLINITQEFQSSKISRDIVVATGEQVTAGLFVAALEELGHKSIPLCGWQIPIIVQNEQIISVSNEKIISYLRLGYTPVITGFQGVDADGNIATLSRGGSDTTAVAIAASLRGVCYIYTDVEGVYEVDPKLKQINNRIFHELDYERMLDMSKNGAKVIHPDAVAIAKENSVQIHILSSFDQGPGTVVGRSAVAAGFKL